MDLKKKISLFHKKKCDTKWMCVLSACQTKKLILNLNFYEIKKNVTKIWQATMLLSDTFVKFPQK